MNIYIACALTHVPRAEFDEYVDFIHGLADSLERSCAAQVKYALRDSDPQLAAKPIEDRARLCYIWDRSMVEWADVLIAEASYPSIGLGIELQIAESKDTPIILSFKRVQEHRAEPVDYETPDHKKHTLQLGEGYVTLMALGLPSINRLVPYVEKSEAYMALAEAIRVLDLQ